MGGWSGQGKDTIIWDGVIKSKFIGDVTGDLAGTAAQASQLLDGAYSIDLNSDTWEVVGNIDAGANTIETTGLIQGGNVVGAATIETTGLIQGGNVVGDDINSNTYKDYSGVNTLFEWDNTNSEIDFSQDIKMGDNGIGLGDGTPTVSGTQLLHIKDSSSEPVKFEKTNSSGVLFKMANSDNVWAMGLNSSEEFIFRDVTGGSLDIIRISPSAATGSFMIRTSNRIGFNHTSISNIDYGVDVNGEIAFRELSADPANPDEGCAVMWLSDGTGSGDDGDIMIKIKAGGSTKTATLVDFSAV